MFEIETVDVRGVATKVFKHAPLSLRAVWESSAVHAGAEYLVYEDERTTFAEAHGRVRALATWLRHQGVEQGDRVAIATRNYPEWALAFWAAQVLGATVVPLNAWWSGPELAYGLRDSGAVVLFADRERAERLEGQLDGTAVRRTVLIRADGAADGVPWAEVVATREEPLPEVDIGRDDDAAIMYTSGTTGRAKGGAADPPQLRLLPDAGVLPGRPGRH